MCLRFHSIHHAQSQKFHLHLRRDNKIIARYNVTLQNKTRFEWCASTIPATSSNNNGNWSLYAYDGPEYTNSLAFILENIVLNITETINRTTTHNTIATTYTTHTTSMSHALYSTSTSITGTFSSSPLPSSAETATHPSTVNCKLFNNHSLTVTF